MPAPKKTCIKCHSTNFKQVGQPIRREIEGFDEASQTHYRAVEWTPLQCIDCGQRTKGKTFVTAKPKKAPARKALATGTSPKAEKACAKSAPTLRKNYLISTETNAPLVSIPKTTHKSEYSSAADDAKQSSQDSRTKLGARRRGI